MTCHHEDCIISPWLEAISSSRRFVFGWDLDPLYFDLKWKVSN